MRRLRTQKALRSAVTSKKNSVKVACAPAARAPFCLCRSLCLALMGTLCSAYHAKMSADEREKVHNDWTHDRIQIIAATIAFGMGARRMPGCCWHLLPCAL